jgi:hypothetical protein
MAAKGMRAPDMMVPLSVTKILSAMPAATSAAPAEPATMRSAATAGLGEAAICAAGRMYWIAALVAMNSAATMNRPPISASGRLRSGRFTSPATMVRSFQPS